MMLLVIVLMSMRMIVLGVIHRAHGRPCRVLLRPVLLPRQILLAVHPNIDFGRGNSAAHDSRNLQPRSHPSAATVSSSSRGETPASTSAPRNMSPLMPEKHSRYAMRI